MSLMSSLSDQALSLGILVKRLTPDNHDILRLRMMLEARGIETVFDIGANDGGFARDLFRHGFKGRIVSFEPIPEVHGVLTRMARRYGGRWIIAPPIAISSENGQAQFHIAGNSVSSSLLKMATAHTDAAPQSAQTHAITVETRRLDDVAGDYLKGERAYLKIDVQGAEAAVLDGAPRVLADPALRGLQLEMSMLSLYEGQALGDALKARLLAAGFEMLDLHPGFRDLKTLRLMQYDGVFFKP